METKIKSIRVYEIKNAGSLIVHETFLQLHSKLFPEQLTCFKT